MAASRRHGYRLTEFSRYAWRLERGGGSRSLRPTRVAGERGDSQRDVAVVEGEEWQVEEVERCEGDVGRERRVGHAAARELRSFADPPPNMAGPAATGRRRQKSRARRGASSRAPSASLSRLQLPKAKGLAGCGPSQRIGAMSPMKPEPLTSASRVDLSAKIANMLMYVNQAFAFCDGRYCRNPARARRWTT